MVAGQILSLAGQLNLQSAGLFVAVLTLMVYWFRAPRPGGRSPPGPRPWPLVGNAQCLLDRGRMHLTFQRWAERYGSVSSVWFGPRMVVLLNDMEAVREALIKQADCFTDRATTDNFADYMKGSVIMASGEMWKERRRFLLTAMRNLGMGKRGVERRINEEAGYLLDSFASQGEAPFDPEHFVFNAVSNIICTISFGHRFDYADPDFARLIDMVKTNLSGGSFAGLSKLHNLLNPSALKQRRERYDYIANFIRGILTEHQSTYDENDMRDVSDVLLRELKQQEQQGKSMDAESAFHRSTAWRCIYDLFVAGTDTTSNTLMWLILYMAVYPDVQRKIQEEIDSVLGSERKPTAEDRNHMPYTHAAILEMLRHRPIAPIGVPHKTAYQTELLGYTIPAKTVVIVNIWHLLHDPKVWKNPEDFDPTRFLSADGKTVEKHEAFIPFSTGRRVCLGETLARTESFIFAVNLLQRFSFSLPVGKPRPRLDGFTGITLGPHPYEIIAKNR